MPDRNCLRDIATAIEEKKEMIKLDMLLHVPVISRINSPAF